MTNINFTYLPGDGIGPEVGAAAMAVLNAAASKFGHTLNAEHSTSSAGRRLMGAGCLCLMRLLRPAKRRGQFYWALSAGRNGII